MKTIFLTILSIFSISSSAFAGLKCEGNAKAYAENLIHFETSQSVTSQVTKVIQSNNRTESMQVTVSDSIGRNFIIEMTLDSEHCRLISLSKK